VTTEYNIIIYEPDTIYNYNLQPRMGLRLAISINLIIINTTTRQWVRSSDNVKRRECNSDAKELVGINYYIFKLIVIK